MNIKSLTGPSIHEALKEARRMFGDEVVLLESIPPDQNRPAQITVMTDRVHPQPTPTRSRPARAQHTRAAAGASVARNVYGYATRPQPEAVPAGVPAGVEERAEAGVEDPPYRHRIRAANLLLDAPLEPDLPLPRPRPTASPKPAASPRGRLFPDRPYQAQALPASPPDQPATPPERAAPSSAVVAWKPLSTLIEKQSAGIQARLEHIENRLHHALIGVSNTWVAHPLYGTLLQQRMHPATINRIFNQVVLRGFAPDTPPAKLKPVVAEELCKLLAHKPVAHTGEPLVFIGPSGAGKTALLLKLARNPGFFGRTNTAVVALLPPGNTEPTLQDPVSIFKRFGVPVVAVRSAKQMLNVLPHLTRFDQILIDTPSMPVRPADARRQLQAFKEMLAPLPPYRVEFVLSTTRILEHFTAGYVAHLPLRPASLAVTHLDETIGWGRVADWLLALELPVRFASTSSRIPDGIQRFTPRWFSHAIMNT